MVDNNDALMREVSEELRREQIEKLWEKYGVYVLGAAAVVVVVVGGMKYWETAQRARTEEAGSKYEAALSLVQSGKADEAQKAFDELAAAGPKGYATLARLNVAASHLKAGRTKEALAVFDEVRDSAQFDNPLIAGFARLQGAMLRLGEADFTEMENRLNPLMTETGAWRVPARELLGSAAFKTGDIEKARDILTPLLGDSSATQGVQARVKIIMAGIAQAELAKKASAGDAAPAAAPAGTAPQ